MYCNACERTVAKAISKCKGTSFFFPHCSFSLSLYFTKTNSYLRMLFENLARGGEVYDGHEQPQGCGNG